MGVFSLRKTLPVPNGAVLVANNSRYARKLPAQIPFLREARLSGITVKGFLRHLVPFTGIYPCRLMTKAARHIRCMVTGHAIAPGSPDSEEVLPKPKAAYAGLLEVLTVINPDAEASRRRGIYQELERHIRTHGGRPVFRYLPTGTAPYAFPFRAEGTSLRKVRQFLVRVGLECHRWPELPESLLPTAQKHYTNVWMVPFLW